FSREEQIALLTRILVTLRESCQKRGDDEGFRALAGDVTALVEQAIRARLARQSDSPESPCIDLVEYNSVRPQPVKPTPIFHEHEIPMTAGYVRLEDIQLWPGNKRLEIHLSQFEQRAGRRPTHDELLEIMTNALKLPGMPAEDLFRIRELARSIANNGVQR